MLALVWIISCSVSVLVAPASSLAVIVWPTSVTCPGAALTAFCPLALPRATTGSPGLTADELPTGTVVSPDAFWSLIKAMSPVLS